MARRKRRWLRWIGICTLIAVVGGGTMAAMANRPRPTGRAGPEADALARRIEQAVDRAAWERTGAVRWTFAGVNRHLWDRTRRLHRVRWDDIEVLRSFDTGKGRAYELGKEVTGGRRDELLDSAYAKWANDSFWLNPLVKLFDEGVTRELIELEGGGQGLLISYSTGGVTPGDAYLWVLDRAGRPKYWRMWVSIIPIGGVKTSWEGWTELSTGAHISTLHAGTAFTLKVGPVVAAETLAELEGETDPFLALVQ